MKIYPSYNPTLVLRDSTIEQGFNPDPAPLALAYSNAPMGSYPLEPMQQDHPAPSFEEALKPKGDGDVHPVKFLPYSSDMGL